MPDLRCVHAGRDRARDAVGTGAGAAQDPSHLHPEPRRDFAVSRPQPTYRRHSVKTRQAKLGHALSRDPRKCYDMLC